MTNYEECVVCFEVCMNSNSNYKCWFLYQFKNKSDYFICLSNAYKCKCSAIAHTKCLNNILKCPTCRKPINKFNLKINLKTTITSKIDAFLLDNDPMYYTTFIIPLKKSNKIQHSYLN